MDVYVYVYDLSCGVTRSLRTSNYFSSVPPIWHSSVVIKGMEFEFGPSGITAEHQEENELIVEKKHYMGRTNLSMQEIMAYVKFLSYTKYKCGTYNVLNFNCHKFTDFLSKQLVRKGIPQYLLDLPEKNQENLQNSYSLADSVESALDTFFHGYCQATPSFGQGSLGTPQNKWQSKIYNVNCRYIELQPGGLIKVHIGQSIWELADFGL